MQHIYSSENKSAPHEFSAVLSKSDMTERQAELIDARSWLLVCGSSNRILSRAVRNLVANSSIMTCMTSSGSHGGSEQGGSDLCPPRITKPSKCLIRNVQTGQHLLEMPNRLSSSCLWKSFELLQ
jgi:hypothetical protein